MINNINLFHDVNILSNINSNVLLDKNNNLIKLVNNVTFSEKCYMFILSYI